MVKDDPSDEIDVGAPSAGFVFCSESPRSRKGCEVFNLLVRYGTDNTGLVSEANWEDDGSDVGFNDGVDSH